MSATTDLNRINHSGKAGWPTLGKKGILVRLINSAGWERFMEEVANSLFHKTLGNVSGREAHLRFPL